MDDYKVWQEYPAFRRLYNKLDLSLRLGYNAGPAGVPVPETGEYVIRPIINLSGMGATAYIQELQKDKDHDVPPGYFWCERFYGRHVSVNYSWRKAELYPINACEGFNDGASLYRFNRWIKLDEIPEYQLPTWITDTMSCCHINIEFIDGKIIEMHGRHGVDFPANAKELIPVWKDTEMDQHLMYNETKDWIFKEDYDDADGTLANPRLGFYYR